MKFVKYRLGNKFKKGALSLEVIAAIAFLSMLIIAAAERASDNQDSNSAMALAQYLNMGVKGSQNFLDSNTSILRTALDGRDYLVVTQDNVIDNSGNPIALPGNADKGLKHYLSARVKETRYKQKLRLYVFKGDHGSGTVHALLSTSGGVPQTGDQKSKDRYMNIARQVVSASGFGIRAGATLPNNSVGNAIIGPDGSWQFDFGDSDYGNIPISAVEEGQLARPLYAYSSAIKDDMLYRVEIDGHPELNAMTTDLHMDGNDITDVGTITISQKPAIQGAPGEFAPVPGGGNGLVIEPYNTTGDIASSAQAICQGTTESGPKKPDGFIFTVEKSITNGQTENDLNGIWMCMSNEARLISDSQNSSASKGVAIKRHGETINKPQCAKGSTPRIFVSQAAFAEGETTPSPITAVQMLAEDETDKWKIIIRVKTTKQPDGEWVDISTAPGVETYNYALVETMCSRDNNTL